MKSISRLTVIIWSVLTLLAYASVWVSPEQFKYSAGVSIFIPFFIIVNSFFLLFYALKGSRKAFIPLALLLIGYPFLQASFGIHGYQSEKEESGFSILNYNVKSFVDIRGQREKRVLNLINGIGADIKCFQEFYPERNTIEGLNVNGEYEVVLGEQSQNLAIYSKFPVINKGLLFEGKRFNNILFADILINSKDTLRIYNAHLQSMGIKINGVQSTEEMKEEYTEVKTRFLDGAALRASQIRQLLNHASDCHYPIIIVGDFNDTPYSYNYFRLSRNFQNSFEKVGKGFGFTYNGKIPFLRIDNQFFSDRIEALRFTTLNSIDYSDHFPVVGNYVLTH